VTHIKRKLSKDLERRKDKDAIKLLSQGYDPVNNYQLFCYFLENKCFKDAKTMVQMGLNIDLYDEKGNSLLTSYIKKDRYDIVKFMVENGCTLRDRNKFKESNLHIAIKLKNYKIANYLIDNRAGALMTPQEFEKCVSILGENRREALKNTVIVINYNKETNLKRNQTYNNVSKEK